MSLRPNLKLLKSGKDKNLNNLESQNIIDINANNKNSIMIFIALNT